MSIFKSHRTVLLVTLTAVLLTVLAILQYRWVGDLGEFELEQAQRNLELSTRGLTRDLGNEFRRIRSTFRFRRGRNLEQEIHEQYQEWIESTVHPDLIAAAYWVDYESGDLADRELRRFGESGDPVDLGPDPAAGDAGEMDSGMDPLRLRRAGLDVPSLEPVDWPGTFAPVRQRLLENARSRDRFRQGRDRDEREWQTPLGPGESAFVVPQNDRGPSGWSVVVLDREVLLGRVIGSLVDEYFGVAGERDYLIRILDSDREDARVLYASDPAAFGSGDAEADIRRNITDEGGDWIIEARHQAGSLETVVGWHRWRNLSLGFGAVLVLGASFSLMLMTTRRAHWLADRQMEFVAGVSHELRTPIAGISSLSQNLADGVVRDLDQAARYGESINAESRRLNEMVEKVLHFSAIRSGQYRYERRPVEVREIVEPELEAVERCSSGGARLKSAFAADLQPVLGDVQALRSVVRNLVSNAVKFGGDDAEVSVSARPVRRKGRGEIELTVSDNGDGIPDADLSHIFEPFYRGNAARAGQVGGSGLGLSLVREIVAAHQGRVEVETREGGGTRFRVYLPTSEVERGGDSDESPA